LFVKTIVCYCLQNSDNDNHVSIAGTNKELYVLVSKNDISLKFDFFYSSYFSAKFCAPSKFTKEYWTLIYISGSFSLAQLLTMF